MSFTKQFLQEVRQVTTQLNPVAIEKCADELAAIRALLNRRKYVQNLVSEVDALLPPLA